MLDGCWATGCDADSLVQRLMFSGYTMVFTCTSRYRVISWQDILLRVTHSYLAPAVTDTVCDGVTPRGDRGVNS